MFTGYPESPIQVHRVNLIVKAPMLVLKGFGLRVSSSGSVFFGFGALLKAGLNLLL